MPRRQDPTLGSIRQAAAGRGLNLRVLGCSNASKLFQKLDIRDIANVLAPFNCCKWHTEFSNDVLTMDSNEASVSSKKSVQHRKSS